MCSFSDWRGFLTFALCLLQWTPLIHACSSGYVETAQVLIANNADIAAECDDERTCLHYAAEATNNAKNNNSVLELVKLLLKRKADPNKKDKNGNFPVHAACQCGEVKVAELLLDLDPGKINLKTTDGETCLHMACGHKIEMVQMLLERGADETIKNKDGACHNRCRSSLTNAFLRSIYGARIRFE